MTKTNNRTPLGNIDTNNPVATRRSNRNGGKHENTKTTSLDISFKKSFYELFDVVFEHGSDENTPLVHSQRRLFPRTKYEETATEVIRRQVRDAIIFISRAVPCMAKIIMPGDPVSIIKGLYNSLAKNVEYCQSSKTDNEALAANKEAALIKRLADVEALAAAKQAEMQAEIEAKDEKLKKMVQYQEAIAQLKAKLKSKPTGKIGLPAYEMYQRLSTKEKVQFLSMFRRGVRGDGPSKRELEKVLEFEQGGIYRKHWMEALKHQKKFGGGRIMPKVTKSRSRIPLAVMKNMLSYLGRDENVQRLAYGSKASKLCNGAAVVVDAVQSNKTMEQLIRGFIDEFDEDMCTICAEERCPKIGKQLACLFSIFVLYYRILWQLFDCGNGLACGIAEESPYMSRLHYLSYVRICRLSHRAIMSFTPRGTAVFAKKMCNQLPTFMPFLHLCSTNIVDKFNRQCAHAKHDGGCCKFTQVPGCSQSFLRKIISTLLSGTCKSFTGLCEIKEEYRRKTELAKKKLRRLGNILNCETSVEKLISRIDANYDWHKASCALHFGDDKVNACMCLPCGFHSEKSDPVHCAHRENDNHKGLCKDCNETEKMIRDIIALAKESYDRPGNSVLEKDFAAEDIKWFKGYQDTIIAYRSHIARCIAERGHLSNILSKLTPEEAVLVFDFKQKVNAAGFRETQAEYFGKAGVICFGVMEMRLMEDDKDMLEVVFTMYVSDDKTQDFGFVSQAIHHYLSEELSDSVSAVHFDSDGAGVFSSSKMKALIIQWIEWVGIQVKSLHISVAGDGKDNLDGKFGKIVSGIVLDNYGLLLHQ